MTQSDIDHRVGTGRANVVSVGSADVDCFGVVLGSDAMRIRLPARSDSGEDSISAVIRLDASARTYDMAEALHSWFGDWLTEPNTRRPVVAVTGADPVEVLDVVNGFRDPMSRCVGDVSMGSAVKSLVYNFSSTPDEVVLVVDVGRRGTSAFLVDGGSSGLVVPAERIVNFGGDVIDDIVRRQLITDGSIPWPPPAEQISEYREFFRSVKEQLSHSAAVRLPGGGAILITRESFDRALTPVLSRAVERLGRFIGGADLVPTSVMLIGGGAAIPAVATEIERTLRLPTEAATDPVGSLAYGAALVAAHTHSRSHCLACEFAGVSVYS
ncbi:Hsp70 family protein [Actinomycetes bacterium M1A6_2h]